MESYKIASKRKRIYAYLIDTFIQNILFLPLSYMIMKVFDNKYSLENIHITICAITYILNRVIYASFNNGSSIGKIVTKIKVISINNKKVSFLTIVLKEIIFYILKVVDIVWMFFDDSNQTAHDRLLDLLVVEKYEKWGDE